MHGRVKRIRFPPEGERNVAEIQKSLGLGTFSEAVRASVRALAANLKPPREAWGYSETAGGAPVSAVTPTPPAAATNVPRAKPIWVCKCGTKVVAEPHESALHLMPSGAPCPRPLLTRIGSQGVPA